MAAFHLKTKRRNLCSIGYSGQLCFHHLPVHADRHSSSICQKLELHSPNWIKRTFEHFQQFMAVTYRNSVFLSAYGWVLHRFSLYQCIHYHWYKISLNYKPLFWLWTKIHLSHVYDVPMMWQNEYDPLRGQRAIFIISRLMREWFKQWMLK